MEQTTFNQETGLIDVFYRDLTRLDSFIAQLQKGALRQVKLKSSNAQGSVNSQQASLGIPGAAKGDIAQTATESNSRDIEEMKDPHDSLLLDLLNSLGLSISESVPLPTTSRLMLLRGNMELRNFGVLKQIIPLLVEYPEITNADLFSKDLSSLKHGEKQLLQKQQAEAKKSMQQMNSMVKLLPTGLEVYLELSNEQLLNGMLRPEFMVDPHEVVFRLFGSSLPGQWYILAIVDTEEGTVPQKRSNQSIIEGIDSMSGMIRTMMAADNAIAMTPILIFRQLCTE